MLILRLEINHSFLHEDCILWYCPTLHRNRVIIKAILGYILNHAREVVGQDGICPPRIEENDILTTRWDKLKNVHGYARTIKELIDRSCLVYLGDRVKGLNSTRMTHLNLGKSRYQKRQKDRYLIIGEVHRIVNLCAIWVVTMFCYKPLATCRPRRVLDLLPTLHEPIGSHTKNEFKTCL